MLRRSSRSTLFPYTTLFRSVGLEVRAFLRGGVFPRRHGSVLLPPPGDGTAAAGAGGDSGFHRRAGDGAHRDGVGRDLRSEEHTSELQSHVNLVCRLLLEKKN